VKLEKTQTYTGYGFYRCDQVENALDAATCSLDKDFCDQSFPVVLCLNTSASVFECKQWYEIDTQVKIGQNTYFKLQNGTCPKNLTKSAPVGTYTGEGNKHPVNTDNSTTSMAMTVWRWALGVIGVVVLIVMIWSVVRACRKHKVVDKMQHFNRIAVNDNDNDDIPGDVSDDEMKPPKKKAPLPPNDEMRAINVEKQANSKDNGTEQLIPDKTTANREDIKDFAIGHDSDADESDEVA